MKYFFEEITTLKIIPQKLEELGLESAQQETLELLSLLKSTVHHSVLNTVFDQLDEDPKDTLLDMLEQSKHPSTVLSFLRNMIDDFDKQVIETVKITEEELAKMLSEN